MNARPLTPLLVLALSAPVFALGWGVRGDGKVTTEARSAQGFKRIELRSPVDAEIKEGSGFSVSLSIDSNLQPLVTTEVNGDTLVVEARESIHPTGHPRLEITLPELRALDIEGSGQATVTGGSQPRDVALSVEGSGGLHYTGAARSLDVKVNGSGDVQLALLGTQERLRVELDGSGDVEFRSGRADALEASLSGSGELKARNLIAKRADLSLSGSGDASLTLGGGALRASLGGSGDLEWWGEAARTDIARNGSGSVEHHR